MTAAELERTLRLAGIVTRRDLLASGTSRNEIATLVRHSSLIRVTRGVYARADLVRKYLDLPGGRQLMKAAAAIAVVGPEAVVSHQSAAELYGINLLGRPGNDVTLTGRPERSWSGRSGIHLYGTELPAEHVTAKAGLPMTTPARTVTDLARTLSFRAGVVAADSALYQKLTTKAELQSVIAALPQRRGIRRAAEVVEFADNRAESPLESIARVLFRDAGLPPPDLQVWLGGNVEPVGRVDFYWKKYRTAVEVDGDLKYQDPARAKAQLKRDSLLRADGFEVVHFDWHDVIDTPEQVVALIREAFRRAMRSKPAPGTTG